MHGSPFRLQDRDRASTLLHSKVPGFRTDVHSRPAQVDDRDPLHYVRDKTLGEDRVQIHVGHAPQALAAVRNAILTALRHQHWGSIADALRYYGSSIRRSLALVKGNISCRICPFSHDSDRALDHITSPLTFYDTDSIVGRTM